MARRNRLEILGREETPLVPEDKAIAKEAILPHRLEHVLQEPHNDNLLEPTKLLPEAKPRYKVYRPRHKPYFGKLADSIA